MPTQSSATFNLVGLNGINGFVLNGEAASDYSGYSVSAAGDVNGDGLGDIIVGAYYHTSLGLSQSGRSYVVFGSRIIGNGEVNLNSLDGANGFILNGEAAGDASGLSVSAAGDVNGDGLDDVIVGAYGHASLGLSYSGRSYVVFGSRTIGRSVVNLNSLNGTNGFVLNGEAAYDYSGVSVSAAGDVNGDGLGDIIVGAYYHASRGLSQSGRSYVVFGSRSVGNGVLNLNSLNGANGFVLNGEATSDQSGWLVSAGGDVNGDGVGDVIVAAPFHASRGLSQSGRSYVVFGSRSVGNGVLNLNSLNGANGFVLNGEATSDQSGWWVSAAGDVNGDGLTDIIVGAPYYTSLGLSTGGRSYVVFGSRIIGNGIVNLNSLNGANGFVLNGEATSDYSGWSVSAAGDVNGDGVSDLIVGAPGHSSLGLYQNGRSYVVFGSRSIGNGVLNLNSLNGINGVVLNGEAASDYSGYSVSAAGDVNGDGLGDIIIGACNNNRGTGRSYIVFGVPPITSEPTQQPSSMPAQLPSLMPSLMPSLAPTKLPSLFPTLLPSARPSLAPTTPPSLSPTELPSTEPSAEPSASPSLTPSFPPTQFPSFSPTKIPSREPSAVPIQRPSRVPSSAPSRSPSFSPTRLPSIEPSALPTALPSKQPSVLPSKKPSFSPTQMPSLSPTPALDVLTNSFSVIQGKRVLLSSDNFAATQNQITRIDSNTLLFRVSNVVAGFFSLVQNPLVPISQFTQYQVNIGQIQFTQDGTVNVPSYQVSLSAGSEQSQSQFGNIIFYAEPTLVNNQITVTPGQHMVLTTANLLAINDHVLNAGLVFKIDHLQNGYFTPTQSPTQLTTQFSQADVSNAQIKFVSNSTDAPPAYDVFVTNSVNLTTGPQAAQVTFNLPVTSAPTFLLSENSPGGAILSSTIRNAIIGGTVSGVFTLGFFVLKICLKRQAELAYEQAKQGVSKEQAIYKENVIQPIAEEVARYIQMKTLGYISNDTMRDYIRAIEDLVYELDIRAVEVNLPEMQPRERTRLLNEIVIQIKKMLLPAHASFCASVTALVCRQIKVSSIEENREALADAIAATMKMNSPIHSTVTISHHNEVDSPVSHCVSETFSASEQKFAEATQELELTPLLVAESGYEKAGKVTIHDQPILAEERIDALPAAQSDVLQKSQDSPLAMTTAPTPALTLPPIVVPKQMDCMAETNHPPHATVDVLSESSDSEELSSMAQSGALALPDSANRAISSMLTTPQLLPSVSVLVLPVETVQPVSHSFHDMRSRSPDSLHSSATTLFERRNVIPVLVSNIKSDFSSDEGDETLISCPPSKPAESLTVTVVSDNSADTSHYGSCSSALFSKRAVSEILADTSLVNATIISRVRALPPISSKSRDTVLNRPWDNPEQNLRKPLQASHQRQERWTPSLEQEQAPLREENNINRLNL